MSYSPLPSVSLSPHTVNVGYRTNHSIPHDSRDDLELHPIGLLNANSDNGHHSRNSSDYNLSAARLAHTHKSKRDTSRGRVRRILRNIWLTVFLPTVACAYLAFCYAAATCVIPVRVYKVEEPEEHICEVFVPKREWTPY